MRLRYFQPGDPFAAASERAEQAYSAACLPPPVVGGDADTDDALSCSAPAADLTRRMYDAVAPRPHDEVVVDSRPFAALQAAMAKARTQILFAWCCDR